MAAGQLLALPCGLVDSYFGSVLDVARGTGEYHEGVVAHHLAHDADGHVEAGDVFALSAALEEGRQTVAGE